MMQIRAVLQDAERTLATDSARIDAEILLAHVLKQSRSYLYTWPERELSAPDYQTFLNFIKQRQDGMPIAYLIGYKEFWSLPLKVTKDVLIPRPETELLVELALQKLNANLNLQIADIGTGSGAIALALAAERKNWQLFAVDISPPALTVAKENAARLQINNVAFLQGSFCQPLPYLMDAIISNPPYIAANDPHLCQGDLQFEPQNALIAEQQGLAAIAAIVAQARDFLVPHGVLMLEHGYDQADAVAALLQKAGFTGIEAHLDFAAIARVTVAYFAG